MKAGQLTFRGAMSIYEIILELLGIPYGGGN